MAEDILGEFKFEGYQQPSAYKMGKGAFETAVKSVGFDDLGAFNKYLADRGIGRVGKDPKGTLELNRLRIEAGLEPYRKIPLVQAAAEKEAFGDDAKKTRPQRAGQMNVGFKAISDAAEKIDGDENKLRFIIDQITERFPQLAKATVINLARTIFMGAGPSLLGADFMSSEATKQMRDELFGPQEQISFAEGGIATMKAGGGMMNINDMITPVGYKEGTKDGTLVGDKEKLFGGKNRARVEKFVNEIIEGEGVTKDLGRGILSAVSIPGIAIKDLIEFLNPVKEAEGSEAFDELISKRQVLISRLNGERLFGGDENEIKSIMDQIKRIDEMMSMLRPKED